MKDPRCIPLETLATTGIAYKSKMSTSNGFIPLDNTASLKYSSGALKKQEKIELISWKSDQEKGALYCLAASPDLQFEKPIRITINLADLDLKGINPLSLKIHTLSAKNGYEENKNLFYDEVYRTLSADITHFSEFTVDADFSQPLEKARVSNRNK